MAFNTQYFFACPGAPPLWRLVNGAPTALVGLSVVDGRTVNAKRWKGSTLYVDDRGRLSLTERPERVVHAVSGRHRLLAQGQATQATDGVLAPRIGVGLDRARSRLFIVVVDGRQPGYSEGASLPELSRLLSERGAYDAIELDGGGSATIVVRREGAGAEVLNSPIHARIPGLQRPVASNFGIRFTQLVEGE